MPLPLQVRLTALIDLVNSQIATTTLPCHVERINVEAEGQLLVVYVRFDDGSLYPQPISAAMCSPVTVMDAVRRAHLIQFHLILPLHLIDRAAGVPECIAYASECAPMTGDPDQTHNPPERLQ